MKKLSIILIVVMLFNFSSISSYANEKSNLSLKLQLSLNNEVVQLNEINNSGDNMLDKKFKINISDFKKLNNKSNYISMRFEYINKGCSDDVEGKVKIVLKNQKYQYESIGYLKFDYIDNKKIYYGTLWLNDNGEIEGAMNVWFDEYGNGIANVSLGTLDSKNGIVMLKFGDEFPDQVIISEKKEDTNLEEIGKNSVISINSIQSNDFEYKASGASYSYSGFDQSGTTSDPVVALNMYARTPGDLHNVTGQERIRVFSKTNEIYDEFDSNPFVLGATVASVRVEWGWTSSNVASIDDIYPIQSSSSESISGITNILSSLYPEGSFLFDIVCDFVAGSISSDILQNTNGDGKYNNCIKYIYNPTNLDELSNNTSAYAARNDNGGVYVDVSYDAWDDSTWNTTAKASLIYNLHYVEWNNTFPITTGTANASHYVEGY